MTVEKRVSMQNSIVRDEYKLVALLAKKDLNQSESEDLVKLLHMNLEWDKVIGIIELHRIGGLAWLNLKNYFFNNNQNRCAFPRLYKYLKNTYSSQKIRALEHFKYTIKVCEELTKNNISYILLKGISLSIYVYSDLGLRDFNDNDILVHPNDIEKAKQVILNLGYEQGETKHLTKVIKPTRRELLVRKMSSHEIIPLVKDVSDSELLLTQHIIDLHFSVNLMTKKHDNNLLMDFFESAIKIDFHDKKISMLNKENLLIFLSEHFYKEAVCHRDVLMYKDLLLYKLCDIYYLIEKEDIDWNYIIEFTKKYNMSEQIYFTLNYIQEIFKVEFLEVIKNRLDIKDRAFLNNVYFYDSEKVAIIYEEDILINRVFDIDKPKIKTINPQI